MWEWLSTVRSKHLQLVDVAGLGSSAIIHLAYIVSFHKFGIFNKLHNLRTSGQRAEKIQFLVIMLLSGILNLASKLIRVSPTTDSVETLILYRFLIIAMVTPTSIILEWLVCQFLCYCTNYWKSWALSFQVRFTKSSLKRKSIQRALESLVLLPEEIEYSKEKINNLCISILKEVQNISLHVIEMVPTGSVFEGFGKPLNFLQLPTNLGTDYDVMFAFKKSDLAIEFIMKDQEFLHIFSLTSNCTFLNQVAVFDEGAKAYKLSSAKARKLMQRIVDSVQKVESSFLQSLLFNLLPFLYSTPRLTK